MPDLLRSIDDCRRASRLGSYFWVPKALAPTVRAFLKKPWIEVQYSKPQFMSSEEVVCFKHPPRSDVVCRVMDGRPISDLAALYMHLAYSPNWWQLAY